MPLFIASRRKQNNCIIAHPAVCLDLCSVRVLLSCLCFHVCWSYDTKQISLSKFILVKFVYELSGWKLWVRFVFNQSLRRMKVLIWKIHGKFFKSIRFKKMTKFTLDPECELKSSSVCFSSPVRGWQEWVCVWRALSSRWGPSSCPACSRPAPLWRWDRTPGSHLATVSRQTDRDESEQVCY